MNPEYAEAFSNLGNVLREIGNPIKAEKVLNHKIKEYEKAIELAKKIQVSLKEYL